MSHKGWARLGLIVAALVLLLALDGLVSLEGLPVLVILLGVALLATERARVWLKARGRAGLATLPFMSACLVLLFAFARGRDLSQAFLLIITLAVVFDILLVALALISEATKRGLRGVAEFAGLAVVGLVLGFALSLAFLVHLGRLGGTSLAEP